MDGSGLVEKSSPEVSPKAFVATEICDGKSVISFSLLVIFFSRTSVESVIGHDWLQ